MTSDKVDLARICEVSGDEELRYIQLLLVKTARALGKNAFCVFGMLYLEVDPQGKLVEQRVTSRS